MQKQYQQLNYTLDEKQLAYLKENFGKMNIASLAKMIGMNYGKTHNNLRLLGLVGSRNTKAKVVKMEGYFDEESFFKNYNY